MHKHTILQADILSERVFIIQVSMATSLQSQKVQSDTSKLAKSWENLIKEDITLSTLAHSLRQVVVVKIQTICWFK